MARASFNKTKYLGGQPGFDKPFDGPMVIDDEGIHMRRIKEAFVLPWSSVSGVAIEGPEAARRRVTAARLLTVGVFAFAVKKKDKLAYLTVATHQGEVTFEVDGVLAPELKGRLARWTNTLAELAPSIITESPPPTSTPASVNPSPPTGSLADELKKLAELRDAGILTDEEFAQQKALLLDQ
jgi:hypothetical protein